MSNKIKVKTQKKVICFVLSLVLVVGFGMGANVFATDTEATQQETQVDENAEGTTAGATDEQVSEGEVASAEDASSDVTSVAGEQATNTKTVKGATLKDDLSSSVTVTDWDIVSTKSPGGVPTLKTVDASNPLDPYPTNYAIGMTRYQNTKFSIDWKLTLSNGTTADGDTFTIPFLPEKDGDQYIWGRESSASEDLYDSQNNKIGSWKIVGTNIVVTISDSGVGKTEIEGTCTTGESIKIFPVLAQDTVYKSSIGGVEKSFKVLKVDKTPATHGFVKTATTASNNTSGWAITNGVVTANDLTNSGGSTVTKLNGNYVITDTFPEGTNNVNLYGIDAKIPYIVSTSDPTTAYVSGNAAGTKGITSYFTEVTQVATDTSLATFKTRIGALQYGVYKDSAGLYTLVVNLGDYTDPNYPIKYKTVFGDEPGTIASAQPWCTADEATLINTSLGSGNCVSGNVVIFAVTAYSTHDKVVADTTISNTAQAEQPGASFTYTAKQILSALSGGATAGVAGSATIQKYDKTTNTVIEGATFKLQQKDAGGNWVDYTAGDGGALERQTDADGKIVFGTLNPGTYRFVETVAAAGYNATSAEYDQDTFTVVSGETEGHLVKCSNEKTRYTITYTKGDHGDFSDDAHGNLILNAPTPPFTGDTVNGQPKGEAGWVFNGWNPTVDDTVTGNATYTATWKEATDTKYKVEHYKQKLDGTYELAETENKTGTTNDPVTATAKTYKGFTENTTIASRVPSGTIQGNGSLVLKLYYDRDEIKVVYDGNGNDSGTAPIDSSNPYIYQDTVTVLGNTGNLAKTGYDFSGWNTKADGSGTSYAAAGTFTAEVDGAGAAIPMTLTNDTITLYAQYTKQTYTVAFDSNGGNYTPASQSVQYNDNATEPKAPTKVGNKFLGWYYTDASGKLVKWNFGDPITGNMTLIAQWSKINSAGTVTPVNGKGKNASTGDNSAAMAGLTLMLTGLGAVVALARRRRNN